MTNEELRIAIAKAKGWIVTKNESPSEMWELWLDGKLIDWEYTEVAAWSGLPNWPENIADAWELVEEMVSDFNRSVELHKYTNGRQWQLTLSSNSAACVAFGRGCSAPLAICAAWLAWKASA